MLKGAEDGSATGAYPWSMCHLSTTAEAEKNDSKSKDKRAGGLVNDRALLTNLHERVSLRI